MSNIPSCLKEWKPPQSEAEKPMPMVSDSDGLPVYLVRHGGNTICTFQNQCGSYALWCRDYLTASGYRTDWAEWSETGAFVRERKEGE